MLWRLLATLLSCFLGVASRPTAGVAWLAALDAGEWGRAQHWLAHAEAQRHVCRAHGLHHVSGVLFLDKSGFVFAVCDSDSIRNRVLLMGDDGRRRSRCPFALNTPR